MGHRADYSIAAPKPTHATLHDVEWIQKEIVLAPRARGFHLVTDEIVRALPEMAGVRIGIAHVFIQHTSASLCINENADPSVRTDLERSFNQLAPENTSYHDHTAEGPDDMPAHVKAALIGASISIPITDGRLHLGTWQGVYLCEHRNRGGARRVVVTICGER